MSVNVPTPVPGATSVNIDAKDVVRIALIATATVLAWETLATLGVWDWRSIPERIGSWLSPKVAPAAAQNGATP